MHKIIFKVIFMATLAIGNHTMSRAQNVGLSFSFFFPKNGDFSAPISPLSIRGIGVNFTNYFGVQTGFSLYRMTGMNVINLPFESKKPLVGPNFTLLIPAELVIQLSGNRQELNLKGGGFFFYSFGQQLNYGNLDRAIKSYEGWQLVNSDFEFDNKPGFGYLFGAEYVMYLKNGYGISLEGNYYIGGASLGLNGSYTGVTDTGSIVTTTVSKDDSDFNNSKVDFTGLEVAIGIIMSGGGKEGGPRKKKRRRR